MVVESTISALEDEGFGVLRDIDVQATLRKKLDEELRRDRLLGRCNPKLARQGLTEELELGALLPCDVLVYEADDGEIVVSTVDPGQLVGVADDPAPDSIAQDVEERSGFRTRCGLTNSDVTRLGCDSLPVNAPAGPIFTIVSRVFCTIMSTARTSDGFSVSSSCSAYSCCSRS